MWKWRWKFGSKNVEFLTNRMFASSMIRVFPSLEHSTDCVRKPADNFRTFVCPLRHQTTDGINAICCRIKHNRAKPMFESASAIFSIADAGEFRFARFYIVCEAVMHRNTKKSAHCLRLVGHTPEVSKRGRDTESDASIRQKEMHTFFSNECSICISS